MAKAKVKEPKRRPATEAELVGVIEEVYGQAFKAYDASKQRAYLEAICDSPGQGTGTVEQANATLQILTDFMKGLEI